LFQELPTDRGVLTTTQNLHILKNVYVNMTTLHAAPSCPFKNVLFHAFNFTSTSAFSIKISSIIDSKKRNDALSSFTEKYISF